MTDVIQGHPTDPAIAKPEQTTTAKGNRIDSVKPVRKNLDDERRDRARLEMAGLSGGDAIDP